MPKLKNQTISGRILAVQEFRFILFTQDGQGYLLTLDRFSPTGLDQLCHLYETNAPVTVEFAGSPDLTTGVAYRIYENIKE